MTVLDYVLQVSYPPEIEEWVQGRLFLSGCSGMWANDGGTLDAYFTSAEARDAAAALLEDHLVQSRPADVPRRDWLELYQQSLAAVEIGERFVVAPDPTLISFGTSRIPIIIPQEQAFGTGGHETTALCLEMLERLPIFETCGLDVGTGSGILAIAMLRLGARKVIAFDHDPDTYAALRLNRHRNGIAEERMPLWIGGAEALRRGTFDVITMNILPDVIVDLLPQVVLRLSGQGSLIVSGVLSVQREVVIAACRRQALTVVSERTKGEWWVGALRKLGG